jgi:hypothetical protein
MLTSDAVEAQHNLMAWCSCAPIPASATRIDEWVLRALERDLAGQVDALVESGSFLPEAFLVVLRADGGLWLTTGHLNFWTIFGVPADAWMPAPASALLAALSLSLG